MDKISSSENRSTQVSYIMFHDVHTNYLCYLGTK